MKILLDECMDWRLMRELPEYEVKSVRQQGWTAYKNGALLELATQSFDVFITVDKNLPFQNYLKLHSIAIVVLDVSPNILASYRMALPQLRTALSDIKPQTLTFVEAA
jgi:predicted nuclease of predicted toxin-antitoxin system